MPTDMLLPSTSGPSRASDYRAEDPASLGVGFTGSEEDMADLRKPDDREEQDRDPRRRPYKAEILIALLTAIAAVAGCVEQLAR